MKKSTKILKEGEQQEPRKFSNEVKKHFLEIVSTYNKYQEAMDRKSDLTQIAETLGGIVEAAQQLAVNEADDWFDKHTVKRNMSELTKLGKEFDKFAVEAKSLDQRLSGLYEDMGHILSRYYKLGDINEDEMKDRLGITESFVPESVKPIWMKESAMSELDIMAQEAKDFKSFTKEVYKEYPTLPKNTASVKWLEGIYKDASTNESVNENFTPQDIAMIKKVVDKEKRLLGLGDIFKKMGWYTDFVMIDSVPPHLKIRKKKNDKQTYLLVNKRYVDKPDWVSGEIAGGLDEGIEKKNLIVKESINFSKEQLDTLRDNYSTLNRIDPSSPTYKKLTDMLDSLKLPALKQLSNANIKFVSMLARNRVQRSKNESINEYKNDSLEPGMKLKSKDYGEDVILTLVEPTEKGWKVKELAKTTMSGQKIRNPKEKIKFYPLVYLKGDRRGFVPMNEATQPNDPTASYMKKFKDEYKVANQLYKKVGGDEIKFYDELEELHDKLGHPKYMMWLAAALRYYKVDINNHPRIKNKSEAEEALYYLNKH